MSFAVHDFLIPLTPDQAVSPGWTAHTGRRPLGITWHWTATWDLALCRRVLGGRNAERKGEASAHYAIGRTFAEGVDRYVTLANRSWHAGKRQLCRYDGTPFTDKPAQKGSRTTVGVETINIGPARPGVAARPEWLRVAATNGRSIVRVQHWTDQQLEMIVAIGREIVATFPNIRPRDHHGHHDICPGYKDDVIGFPFALVLRGIYPNETIPDVWTPTSFPAQRQRILIELGHDLGSTGADARWGQKSDNALLAFQRMHGLEPTGHWSTFVSWKAFDLLKAAGKDLATVAQGEAP